LEVQNPFENAFRDKQVFAAWSENKDIVLSSSSGGVGYELTQFGWKDGYKICGVVFDAPNNICKHIIVETESDLEAIKTSKYLQSYTIEAFSQFKKGEKYLVVGTPCQIYGLRKWIQLKKWEDNFILVDFFCHGTPSFLLWKKYKAFLNKKYGMDTMLKDVNFRKKNLESKWHFYAILIRDFRGKFHIQHKAFTEDMFFRFFLNNSCLNKACYECKCRLDNCFADIRIADFWGSKYINNDDGVSLVITNTEKGKQVFEDIRHKLIVEKCDFADLKNSQSVRFLHIHSKRDIILKELKGEKVLEKIYTDNFKYDILLKRIYDILLRIKNRIKQLLK
jgi:coenzyme F420-reducing hydrogenase beta subunit